MKNIFFNYVAVSTFVESIEKELSYANKSWMIIASEFAKADEQLETDEFKDLLKKTRFGYSTVRKLIKIAKSDRIKNNSKALELIDAWSTLHEIVKLDDEKFKELSLAYLSSDSPQHFTRSDVERIKNGTRATFGKKFPIYGTVRIDMDSFSSWDDFELFKLEFEKLSDSLAKNRFIQIDVTNFEERLLKKMGNQQKKEMSKFERDLERRKKNRLREIVKLEKQKCPPKNRDEEFVKRWGLSDEDIFAVSDANEMIKYFGYEPITP